MEGQVEGLLEIYKALGVVDVLQVLLDVYQMAARGQLRC